MYHLTEAYLMAGGICLLAALLGALLFGASVVAPLIARSVDDATAGVLLRRFWPRYHRIAIVGGLTFTLLGAFALPFSALPTIYSSLLVALAALTTISFYVGDRLIPSINAARDRGDQVTFDRLHRLDVACVGAGLVAGFVLLAALVYVLPGQFTFWPSVR